MGYMTDDTLEIEKHNRDTIFGQTSALLSDYIVTSEGIVEKTPGK